MKHKLIMIWRILRCKEWIVVADSHTHIDATMGTCARTMCILTEAVAGEIIQTQEKMDSAVDEVNNIINGKV